MNKDKKRLNHTHVTIGLCFLMVLFGLGMWGQKSLFIEPTTSALGISRSAYSLSDTMRYIATAVINIFFGALINKFGSKKLILAGFVALTGSAVLYGVANNVFVFYAGGFLLGIGLSWTSTTIVGYVVKRVCKKNQGTIMGFILAANGIGGAIAAQIFSPLINQKGNPFGYRNAYFLMAGIFVFMFLLLLFFYKEKKGVEQNTTDTNEKQKKARGAGWVGVEFNKATKKLYFYGACICILFTGLVLQGVTSIYAAHMKDVGLNPSYIAIVASVSSIALSVFKFLNGFIYDRAGLRITITIDCVASILVMLVLYFITNSLWGMVLAMIYAVIAGIALPLETVMLPIYASDLFGDKSFNKILGIFVSLNQVGYALGAPVINLCYDLLGSYKLSLIICAVVMLLVIIGLQVVISSAHKQKKLITQKLVENV